MQYAAGNFTLDCANPTWSGTSSMFSSARSIKSFGSVTANNLNANRLVSFAGSMYADTWRFNNNGMMPTSVKFTFDVTGSEAFSALINANSSGSMARLMFGFDTDLPSTVLGVNQGQFTATYDITPAMFARDIPILLQLSVFSVLQRLDGTLPMSGIDQVDYSNTLKMSNVDFFQQQNNGSQLNITKQVSLTSWSGTDYLTPLTAVPEPSTFALMGCGVLAIFVIRRRGHNKA